MAIFNSYVCLPEGTLQVEVPKLDPIFSPHLTSHVMPRSKFRCAERFFSENFPPIFGGSLFSGANVPKKSSTPPFYWPLVRGFPRHIFLDTAPLNGFVSSVVSGKRRRSQASSQGGIEAVRFSIGSPNPSLEISEKMNNKTWIRSINHSIDNDNR